MQVWPDALKGLKNPPVVETALAIQFAPIPGLTTAHIGLFWKNYLDASWVAVREAVPLDEFSEKNDPLWKVPTLQFAPVDNPAGRIQITNGDNDRVVQIQNNKAAYNWRKGKASYPSFDQTCREFLIVLEGFRVFLRDHGLGDMRPNHWELIYIDQIPKGELWQTAADFCRVLPGLFPESFREETIVLESASAERRFEIQPRRGRVYVSARHAMLNTGEEIISLQSSARGVIESQSLKDGLIGGLKLGHEAIGRAFVAIASEAAFSYWKGP